MITHELNEGGGRVVNQNIVHKGQLRPLLPRWSASGYGDYRSEYNNGSWIHSRTKQENNEFVNQASVRWRQPRSLLWATQAEVIIHYQIGGIIHIIVTHRLAMRRTRSVKFNAGHPEHLNIRICYHFPSVAKTVEQWSNTIGVSRKGAVNRRDSYREIIYAQRPITTLFPFEARQDKSCRWRFFPSHTH